MTLKEYHLRMEAYQLKQIHEIENLARQAWFNQAVQATTGGKKPKPKFKEFSQFYDAESAIDKIRQFYEPSYKPTAKKTRSIHSRDLFNERVRRYQKIKRQKGG